MKKDLKRAERERDNARDIVRTLSNEKRSLGQDLQLSEARRIEEEENLLNTAEYDAEVMAADHDRKMTTANKAWAKRLKKDLEELRLQSEDATRRVSEEHELAKAEVTAGYIGEIRWRREMLIFPNSREEKPLG